jgi:hypothetical protein
LMHITTDVPSWEVRQATARKWLLQCFPYTNA